MSEPLAPEILSAPERVIVGTTRRYTMMRRSEIPRQWQEFFDAGHRIPGAIEGPMFGVSFEMDPAGGFRYCVGKEVAAPPSPLPEELDAVTLSAGTYAVLRRLGPVARMTRDFDRMFSEWLPGSGRQIREGAVFERYPPDDRNGPDVMAYEIWVPVTGGAG